MLFRTRSVVVVMAIASACVLLVGMPTANADLVNGSFELPALAENGYQAGMAGTSWNGSGSAYILNGTNGSGDGISGPADGNQYWEGTEHLWQNTGIPLVVGNTYTLSFKANRGDLDDVNRSGYLTFANDTSTEGEVFGSVTYSGLAAGVWTTETVSATYMGDPGKYLGIVMGNGTHWTGIDAVSVSVTQAPEPTASVLIVTGIIGLLCYAWKKRK